MGIFRKRSLVKDLRLLHELIQARIGLLSFTVSLIQEPRELVSDRDRLQPTLATAHPARLGAQSPSPATFLIKIAISSFSIVPDLSLSNSAKQASKSSSENSPPSEPSMSQRVFFTNAFVSSLSRAPELSLSYSAQMSSTHFLITASMFPLICKFYIQLSPC